MKNYFLSLFGLCLSFVAAAQITYPVNGAPDQHKNAYAFTNATIQTDPNTTLEDATLLVRDGKVVAVGTNVKIPADVITYDLDGKYIYPSFFDPFSNYGMPEAKAEEWKPGPQDFSKKKGAYSWNQAIQPEKRASEMFKADGKNAAKLRKHGFGLVLTHQHDGIFRGTSVLTTLADLPENETILKTEVANQLSFSKGVSRQDYPGSLMGTIALIRQMYYDAEWYDRTKAEYERNISIEAVNRVKSMPQVFAVRDKLSALRATKIGTEFGYNYIIKGSGDEYQRIEEIKATGSRFILPLNFPAAYDVEDAYVALNIALGDMKHWEMAPSNAAFLAENEIPIAFTAKGLKDHGDFLPNLRKAVERGLPADKALAAITTVPAEWFGVADQIGSLAEGKIANFIVMTGPLFEDGKIEENWVQGQRHVFNRTDLDDIRGTYDILIDGQRYEMEISGSEKKPSGKLTVIKKVEDKDSLGNITGSHMDTSKVNVTVMREEHNIAISFTPNDDKFDGPVRASGNLNRNGAVWDGRCELPDGTWITWNAIRKKEHDEKGKDKGKNKRDKKKKKKEPKEDPDAEPMTAADYVGDITYPMMAYGWTEAPEQQTVVIKNATIWTCEEDGILEKADIVLQNGKIAKIGTGIDASAYSGARVIDAKGKHVTPGIVDEHTHIAGTGGINEGAQASSAEVRIGDIVNSDDINIYRQLSMGTTSAQILHGSANPIGGQSAIIKMRWGSAPEAMKLDTKDGFIKFALGENVKQVNWGDFYQSRFPQSRMGVEQVFYDHFIRAREYGNSWKNYAGLSKKDKLTAVAPRRDLEMEAILEILEQKRFISCHSYVQSEVNMLMHVGDSMGFTVNTFTHILEGYKLADKMAAHGAGGSTFSDWWAYKYEVKDAIPYNCAIMHEQGVTVAVNSDDAEMARRLNQEAAKAVKYGGMSQEDAFNMVTINPAKLLHIDDKVGSLKVGKDADVVIWSDNPLSIYAQCEKTFIDGKCYFDLDNKDTQEDAIAEERARLIKLMIEAKNGGESTQPAKWKQHKHYHCDTLDHDHDY